MSSKETWRILAVDDEPINLEIIGEILDDPGYRVEFAANAESALERLEASGEHPFHLAILDRMMPGMSGIELLRRMKADTRFSAMPVIMQTAAAAPAQVREGIESGAYYYLTKPYEPEALAAIVRAALADVAEQARVVRLAEAHADALRLALRGEFAFRTLTEAEAVAGLLAALCPVRDLAAMGLSELFFNAVEHGNLGITYGDKTRLKKEDAWEAEIAKRLADPVLGARRARVSFDRRSGQIVFTVIDEGTGFDWSAYLDFDAARATDPNGRGIAMARRLAFSTLEYQAPGNVVVATVDLLVGAP